MFNLRNNDVKKITLADVFEALVFVARTAADETHKVALDAGLASHRAKSADAKQLTMVSANAAHAASMDTLKTIVDLPHQKPHAALHMLYKQIVLVSKAAKAVKAAIDVINGNTTCTAANTFFKKALLFSKIQKIDTYPKKSRIKTVIKT